MAGSYPDVPGHRMAWDRDGTVLCLVNGGAVEVLDAATRAVFNSENVGHAYYQAYDAYVCLIFPEKRDIVGMYVSCGDSADVFGPSEWSADTTNGVDGTWTAFTFTRDTSPPTKAALRNNIRAVSLTGVKAVRHNRWNFNTFSQRARFSFFHVYGTISAGENPNRLRFWHPTNNAEITGPYFDLGDVARGSASIVQFRIKNNSSTLQANSVGIAAEALTDTSPTNVGQHQFSADGATYSATLNIGNLAAGAISSVLYMRRDTAASAGLSLWWTRFVATASSWT